MNGGSRPSIPAAKDGIVPWRRSVYARLHGKAKSRILNRRGSPLGRPLVSDDLSSCEISATGGRRSFARRTRSTFPRSPERRALRGSAKPVRSRRRQLQTPDWRRTDLK